MQLKGQLTGIGRRAGKAYLNMWKNNASCVKSAPFNLNYFFFPKINDKDKNTETESLPNKASPLSTSVIVSPSSKSTTKVSNSSCAPDTPVYLSVQHPMRKRSVSIAEDQLRKSLGALETRRSSDGYLSLASSRLHNIYNSGGLNKKVQENVLKTKFSCFRFHTHK